MNTWTNLPGNANFTELLHAFKEYAQPFRAMWPFFWLKAAAVKVDDAWPLCVFSLSGQWSDVRQEELRNEKHESLAVVSKRLDASEAWQMIESMCSTKTMALTDDIFASVPDVYVSPSVIWQSHFTSYSSGLEANVAEPASWWYFNTGGDVQWLRDPAQRLQVDRTIRPTLDYLSEESFQSFISARLAGQRPPRGGFPSFDTFNYHLDLPLALRANLTSYLPSDTQRRIEVDCHAPLELGNLVITEGDIPNTAGLALPIEEDASTVGGWAVGHTSIAKTTSVLRIASPQLGRILTYQFTVPTLPEVVANAVGYLYAPHDASIRGTSKWANHLQGGTGTDFELALLNALARLGIVALFGGQITTPDAQTSGTATPGFDLLALDFQNRRAVAISAKGTIRLPSREHLSALRQAVVELSPLLSGWIVFGLVVCHAQAGDIANWAKPDDLNLWGQVELEVLAKASSARAIAGLLWVPPWASEMERTLYQINLPWGSRG